MRQTLVILSALILVISSSGCATIITGTSQKVPVSSDPSGATVMVDGKKSYTTPTRIKLERKKDHLLQFTKEGYDKEEVKLVHTISGAIAGNAVLFGIAGLLVDNYTGAQYKLIPTKVNVLLKKTAISTSPR